MAAQHANAKSDLLSALHEISLDGPATEKDLADETTGEMTPLCKDLCRLWLQRHGRRFSSYKERSDKHVLRGHRKKSEAALTAAQGEGREALSCGFGEDKHLLGLPKTELIIEPAERRRNYKLCEKLRQFRTTTGNRKQQASQRKLQVRGGANPYPVGELRTGGLFNSDATPDDDLILGRGRGDVKVLSLCSGQPLSLITGTKLHDQDLLRVEDGDKLVDRCRTVKLVLVESWAHLDHVPSGAKTPLGQCVLLCCVWALPVKIN